jgi:competence protein ComEC
MHAPPSRPAAAGALAALRARAEWLGRELAGQAWLPWAPVAVALGIALWFLLPSVGQRQAALFAAAAVALAGLALRGRAGTILAAAGVLFALGLFAADVRSRWVAAPQLYHRVIAQELDGEVRAIEVRRGREQTRLTILRDATPDAPPVHLHVNLSGPPPEWLAAGQRIRVRAVLGPAPAPILPAGPDAARRAWFDGISASGRATGPPMLLPSPTPETRFAAWLETVRQRIDRMFAEAVGGEAAAVATALVTGSQGQISPDILEAMRTAGLVHLLTVSGFHIGVASAAAFLLLRWTLAAWPWFALRVPVRAVAALGAGATGTVYALLAGGNVPAVRAAIIAWVVALAVAMGRNPLSIRLLAFAALIILLVRPEVLMGPSFQLSFAAVLSLILLANSRIGKAVLVPQPDDGALAKVGRYGLALAASGLVVELVLTPIAITHFGRSGVYGVFANMAAIPLTSFVVMPLLAVTLLAAPFGLAGLAAGLLRPAIDSLVAIATTVSAWPGALWTTASVPMPAQFLGIAGALMLGLFAGPLRLAGLAPLLLALGVAIFTPRPDIFISPDGTHVGIVRESRLHMLRATRGGFAERSFREASGASEVARIDALPGARCTREACLVTLEGRRPLTIYAIRSTRLVPERELRAACARADLVVAPRRMPGFCQPRWLLLDREALKRSGAVTIRAHDRRLDSVGARSGDHPWGPAALPGRVPVLLGPAAWRDPLPD